jgi:UvrD-like helicase C-terminal domain
MKYVNLLQALQLGEGSIPFEEEKRLCYVAMTRAKSELIMTWRQSVIIFTSDGLKTIERPRSRFLDVLVSKKITTSPKEPVTRSKKTAAIEKARQIKSWSSSAATRNVGTMSATPREKFSGTTSVYANTVKGPSPVKKVEKHSVNNQAPNRPLAPTAARSYSSNDLDRAILPRSRPVPISQPTPKSMDSSWFFPIGSKVRHKHFGDGIVLPPSATVADGTMAVSVAFDRGEQRVFPVDTTDLSPIVI